MLMNKCITLVVVIATVNIVALATTGFHTFTQNSCSSLGYSVCAQSDLSLPIPSENDIEAPGLQQRPGDQSQEADKDLKGSVHGYAGNGDTNDVNAFLLPFP